MKGRFRSQVRLELRCQARAQASEQQRGQLAARPGNLRGLLPDDVEELEQPHTRRLPLLPAVGTHGLQGAPQGTVDVPQRQRGVGTGQLRLDVGPVGVSSSQQRVGSLPSIRASIRIWSRATLS